VRDTLAYYDSELIRGFEIISKNLVFLTNLLETFLLRLPKPISKSELKQGSLAEREIQYS
jgi:hypothetical protein